MKYELARKVSPAFSRIPDDLVEPGAITQLPLVTSAYRDLRGAPVVISGKQTKDIAEAVVDLFRQHKNPAYRNATYLPIERNARSLEKTIRELEAQKDKAEIFIIGVGGGSTSDLAKVCAAKTSVQWAYFMTATSSDAAYSSSLGVETRKFVPCYKKLKISLPLAVIVDPDIVIQAPPEINRAGIGDLDPTGIRDWELAITYHLPNEGHFNQQSVDLAREAFWDFFGKYAFGDKFPSWFAIYTSASDLDDDQQATLKTIYSDLARSLIKSGKAMAYAKSSSPSSGDGHKLAHLLESKTIAPHGNLAGLGGLLMLYLQSKFFREDRASNALHTLTREGLHYGCRILRDTGLIEAYRAKRSKDNAVSWTLYRNMLNQAGLPTTAEQANLLDDEWLEAAQKIPDSRVERSGTCTLIRNEYGKEKYDKIIERKSKKLKII